MKKWAFLVHYRDEQDKEELKKVFGKIPKDICVLSTASDGGIFVLIPQSPEELLMKPKASQKIILEAVNFASNLGATVVGFGELTASLTSGGRYLLGKAEKQSLIMTSGNSLTAAVVFSEVFLLSEKMNNPSIGIVGATGSVGTAVSQYLSKEKKKRTLLIARNKTKLSLLSKEVGSDYSVKLEDLKTMDIVVVLISGIGNIIKREYIGNKTIIYDATQPRNVNPEIFKNVSDVSFVEGGLVYNSGTELNFNFNLPDNKVFACWAETKLLTQTNKKFYSEELTGRTNYITATSLFKEAKRYGYV
jgi:fatty aldehyde-generating acyl-ACP reductase